MLPTNYDIISVLDDLYRRVSISAVAIVCVCGNPNNEHDLPDIRTFRYQTLSMVHNINKVNRTVRNPFGEDDFYYLGDDYYLDLIQNVFSDFDKVGREFVQAIENTSATSDSFLCERMITTFAYAVRRQSDSSINFGSLSRITADPLPTARSEKLAVIREYFDTTSRALAAFSEFVQLGGLDKINWRRTRFRNLTHYIKEFLVPFFLYQQLSGAHFMRWVTYSWQKAIRPNFPTLQSASLSYDPESFLRMPSYSDQRGYPKNIWCSSQTDQYCGALICNQDTMATGSALRVLQLPAPRPSLDFLQTVRGASHGLTGSDFTLDPQFLELSFPNGLDILASVASSKVLVGKRTVRLEAIEVSDSTESPIPPKQPSNPPKSLKLASRPHPSKQKSRGGHLLCPMSGCPTRVSLAKDMDRHLKSIHGGGKEFYCPLPMCKRSRARRYPFDRLDNWRRHVRIHNMGFTDKDCIIVDMGIL